MKTYTNNLSGWIYEARPIQIQVLGHAHKGMSYNLIGSEVLFAMLLPDFEAQFTEGNKTPLSEAVAKMNEVVNRLQSQ